MPKLTYFLLVLVLGTIIVSAVVAYVPKPIPTATGSQNDLQILLLIKAGADANIKNPFGDWAIVTGRTNAAGEYQGEVAQVMLRFTDVFAYRNGRWQVVASQATLLNQ